MKPHTMKSGISLVAVLMFMLAATTASIVVYRHIGQENLTSGARLKQSEAQQASQAGFEAVQGWLTNKGADVGAVIRTFEMQDEKKPVRLVAGGNDLLDGQSIGSVLGKFINSKRKVFSVYLIDANTSAHPYRLKFLSVGEARDGSKFSQVGIFTVDGLYRMNVKGEKQDEDKRKRARKVPPFFGTVGQITQGTMSSAYIMGDVPATSGVSTYGDLIVTGSYAMASGAEVGCPLKSGSSSTRYSARSDAYPGDSDYAALVADSVFGSAYVRENLSTQGAGYCGSLYVGGDMTVGGDVKIWGDLYVEGDLILNQNLTVYGNVTVKGNITMDANGQSTRFHKNFVLPNTGSTHSCNSYKITVNGTTCYTGANAPCVSNTPITDATCNSTAGGDTLGHLGDQITIEKLDKNGNACTTGPDCMYRIPDPLILGAANDWKATTIPPDASCNALRGFAVNDVIRIDVNLNVTNFMNAVNACHGNGAVGNWDGGEKPPKTPTKWLVLRVDWNNANNFQDQTFEGNIIIVVENKPSETIRLPLTTEKTNVLIYLLRGANTIEINNPGSGKHRNYFIYSEADIDIINGSQYLEGNIFMANGTKVGEMADPTIKPNDALFDALSDAGVIADNKDRCKGTKSADANGKCKDDNKEEEEEEDNSSNTQLPELPEPPPGLTDKKLEAMHSYVPTVPHLEVKLQSQYASQEIGSDKNAEPAILVMPRLVYVKDLTNMEDIAKNLTILSLNGASKTKIQPNFNLIACGKPTKENVRMCSYDFQGCSNPLCKNAFYIMEIKEPTNSDDQGKSSAQGASSSSGTPYSSATAPSSSGGGGNTVNITCKINGGTANVYMKPDTYIDAKFECSNGLMPTGENWNSYPTAWKVEDANKTYTISGGATCDPAAGYRSTTCPTVTVARITCTNKPGNSVSPGSSINIPELVCNNGYNDNKAPNFSTGTPSSLPATAGVIGSKYTISGTAHCSNNFSDSPLRDIPFSCPEITVLDSYPLPSNNAWVGPLIGNVTLTCNDCNIQCYSEQSYDIDIGCGTVNDWSHSGNPSYIGYFGGSASLSCNIPAGSTVYCRKSN